MDIEFHYENAFQEWLKTKGVEANNMNTLTGQPYLQNRLNRAFYAGATAMQEVCKAKIKIPITPERIGKFKGKVYKK